MRKLKHPLKQRLERMLWASQYLRGITQHRHCEDPDLSGGVAIYGIVYIQRLLKKRCRILPAGGLGVSPSVKSPPRLAD